MEKPVETMPLRCSLAARLREVLTRDPASQTNPGAIQAFDTVNRILEDKARRSRDMMFGDLSACASLYLVTVKLAQRSSGQNRHQITAQVLEALQEAKVSPHRFGKLLREADAADPTTMAHFMQEAKKREATRSTLVSIQDRPVHEAESAPAKAEPVKLPLAA